MSSIGDSLQDKTRKELISSQIQPGAVFFLFDEFAKKEKYVVVLGVDKECIMVGTLYINSEINTNVIRTTAQRELQFKLKCSEYSFLSYDSFVNTSYILKRKFEVLVDSICENNGVYIGQITERDFGNLRSIMSLSREISRADKKDFGLI